MSTYGQAGATYGQPGGTYGNFLGIGAQQLWLTIYSDPVLQLYQAPAVAAALDASLQREQVVSAFGRVQGLDGENPNMSVSLVSSARLVDLFAEPPLGARAELWNSAGVLFEGVVTALSLGDSPALRVAA